MTSGVSSRQAASPASPALPLAAPPTPSAPLAAPLALPLAAESGALTSKSNNNS